MHHRGRLSVLAGLALLAACSSAPTGPDPQAARGYLAEGKQAAKRGDHEVAVGRYSQAIEANPEFPEAYFERGRSRIKLRRDPESPGDVRPFEDQAFRDYSMAIKYNPAYADAYFNRAMLLASRAQYKPAAEDLLNASRYNPKDPEAHYYLGWIYESYFEDKIVAAMQHYEKYLELGGTDAEARRKVMAWKELMKQGAAPPPPGAKAPTPEEEARAMQLHEEALNFLKSQKREDAVKAVETLLKDFGHTRYVREKKTQLEALLNAFKK